MVACGSIEIGLVVVVGGSFSRRMMLPGWSTVFAIVKMWLSFSLL